MTEKTVQVSVSLVMFAEATLRNGSQREREEMAVRLNALLSQSTVEPSTEDAWEKAAQIAERDAVGVTLRDLRQFPVVQATGSRIAFNIRAAAQKETP